ncbi:hypothetical protein B0J13DRAFT_616685 [Dactylonectria estremocensis]|uniref:Uncharacterized protein n=1 Tax=Dactylonectria estremocensis TaxID=1079267 RepID=A0A9P9FBG9_9HYPO|nr:hypothetical protein B0J13DRAFT_616685 [Dactylonectria estremocensis]
MRFSVFSVVAASSLVSAAYEAPVDEGTTTLTSTTTRVITLTACPDSVVDCPYRTTTSTEVVITTSTPEPVVTPTTSSSSSIYVPPVVNTTSSVVYTSVDTPIYTPPVSSKAISTHYPINNTTTKGSYTYTAPAGGVTTVISYEAPAGTTVVEGVTSTAPATVPTDAGSAASGLVVKSGFVGAAVMAALVALY